MNAIFQVFASWRMAVVLLTGFSCGIPLALTAGTLQAWMKTEHLDIGLIGVFSLVGLPYTLKFLWSPLMDRFVPPFLGRRRGWMLVAQCVVLLGILAMAFADPTKNLTMMAVLALLVAFFSASQDIAVDAYRTEILHKDELGAGASLYIMGYRLALLVSGGVALILADRMPWKNVYMIMAATMGVGIIATLLAPEPAIEGKPPASLRDAIVMPFFEFFRRRGILAGLEMLLFIIIYKLDVALAMAITTPFMMDLGFSKTDVGTVLKSFGLVATIVGTLIGGALMTRIGIKKALWAFGIVQGISGATFMLLAHLGHNYPIMVTAVTVENICSGLGTAAFSAFIMSLCDKRYTATQYALLTSVMALTRVIIAAPSGYLQEAVGWETYFLITILLAVPGLALLLRYDTWMTRAQAANAVPHDGNDQPATASAKT